MDKLVLYGRWKVRCRTGMIFRIVEVSLYETVEGGNEFKKISDVEGIVCLKRFSVSSKSQVLCRKEFDAV